MPTELHVDWRQVRRWGIDEDAADLTLESGADRLDELRAILADIRRDDLRASEVIGRLRTLLAKHDIERHPFEINTAASDVVGMPSHLRSLEVSGA